MIEGQNKIMVSNLKLQFVGYTVFVRSGGPCFALEGVNEGRQLYLGVSIHEHSAALDTYYLK